MKSLRAFARNQECQIRIYQVCNYDPETTVWAHYSLCGVSGTGLKAPDLCGAFACSCCHDVIDGRVKSDLTRIQIESHMLHGMVRSLKLIDQEYRLVKR